MVAVEIEGKWGYINKKGEFIIKPIYDKAEKFVDGVAKVIFENRVKYIDENGVYLGVKNI